MQDDELRIGGWFMIRVTHQAMHHCYYCKPSEAYSLLSKLLIAFLTLLIWLVVFTSVAVIAATAIAEI